MNNLIGTKDLEEDTTWMIQCLTTAVKVKTWVDWIQQLQEASIILYRILILCLLIRLIVVKMGLTSTSPIRLTNPHNNRWHIKENLISKSSHLKNSLNSKCKVMLLTEEIQFLRLRTLRWTSVTKPLWVLYQRSKAVVPCRSLEVLKGSWNRAKPLLRMEAVGSSRWTPWNLKCINSWITSNPWVSNSTTLRATVVQADSTNRLVNHTSKTT